MGFVFTFNDEISLNDLINIKNKNGSIIRSSHIGNWNKSTLALGKMDFHIIMHEFLRGNASSYEPSILIKNGDKIELSTDFNSLQLYDNSFSYCNLEYYKASKFHYDNLLNIFNNVESVSSYFLKNRNILEKTIDFLVSNYKSEFTKYIDSNGKVYTLDESDENYNYYSNEDKIVKFDINELKNEFLHLLETTDYCLKNNTRNNPSGILPNTKIYLFTTCIIELMNMNIEKTDDSINLYHLSGLRMIDYIIKNDQSAEDYNAFFDDAYNLILNKIDGLPKDVVFNLIPTDFINYISCKKDDNCEIMNQIFNLYVDIENLREEKKIYMRDSILTIQEKLRKIDSNKLFLIIDEVGKKINIRRYKKLIILRKKCEIEQIINELSNIMLISQKDSTITELENKIDELEKLLLNLVSKNEFLFKNDLTQNDLTSGDDIYIANKSFNMPIKNIMKFTYYINENNKQKQNIQNKLVKKLL